MALTSLLVCADAEAVQVLSRILQDLSIAVETCGHPQTACSRIKERRFDALVVDCEDENSAADFINEARNSTAYKTTVIIALVNSRSRPSDVFEKGANFILYKPLSRERALHSLYAARGLLRQERRTKRRIPVHALASVAYPGKEDAAATVLELNETGLGIRTTEPLPKGGKVYFQFCLPGQSSVIRLAGEVMWRDTAGRVGVRFVNLPQTSKRSLENWLQAQSNSSSEEQPPSAANDASVRLSAGLGLLSASAPDRRNRSRRSCCLGAEVYRGENAVPHRCSLSDISNGGCYVETTEPFPPGTELRLVVRTHEMKLNITGKVQSVHHGFGMGVRFNLTNDNQRAVQELLTCAETPSKLTQSNGG